MKNMDTDKALAQKELCLTMRMKMLPGKESRAALLKTMRAYRNACNYVSAYAFRFHKTSPISLNSRYYREIREKFALPSQMTQSVFRTVAPVYKTMETSGAWTKAATFRYAMATWVFGRDYKLNDTTVSLRTLDGWVDVPVVAKGNESYFEGAWKLGSARIKICGKDWYLEVPGKTTVSELPADGISCVVGIDVGLNMLVAAYDSNGNTRFYRGKSVKHRKQLYRNLRDKLSKKNTIGAKRKLREIGNKEYRWMNDVTHRTAKALVDAYPSGTVFVLEDLKGMSDYLQRKYGSTFYALASMPYLDLQQKIAYKALMRGSRVIKVDPKYTSQTCPKCGFRSKENRNTRKREFRCLKCGYTSNDDRVAAMNILSKGLNTLRSQYALDTT